MSGDFNANDYTKSAIGRMRLLLSEKNTANESVDLVVHRPMLYQDKAVMYWCSGVEIRFVDRAKRIVRCGTGASPFSSLSSAFCFLSLTLRNLFKEDMFWCKPGPASIPTLESSLCVLADLCISDDSERPIVTSENSLLKKPKRFLHKTLTTLLPNGCGVDWSMDLYRPVESANGFAASPI